MPSVKILNSNNEWEYAATAGNGVEAQVNLDRHIEDKENPHETTKEQLGIYTSATEPTDAPLGAIWIDPNDEPTESYYIKEEIDERFVTKDEAVLVDGSNTMTGNLTIEKSSPFVNLKDAAQGSDAMLLNSGDYLYMQVRNVSGSDTNKRQLLLANSDVKTIDQALQMVDYVDSSPTLYPILHSGNISTYAAPAGKGYGDTMEEVVIASADETFETYTAKLEAVTATMKNYTAKQIMAAPPGTYGLGRYLTTIFKYNANHIIVVGFSTPNPNSVCGWRIVKHEGVWKVLEWDNPPMSLGVEYRTTERLYGKPIYKKMINVGYVATGTQTYEHGIENMDIPYTLEVINVGGWGITNASGNNQYFDKTNIQFTTGANQGSVVN